MLPHRAARPSATAIASNDPVERWWVSASDVPGLNVEVVHVLNRLKQVHLGDGHPLHWRADDIEVLLLDVLPRELAASDAFVRAVVPTMRSYFRWLHDHGVFDRPLVPLLDALDAAYRPFRDGMADHTRFGTAKRIITAMGVRGTDHDGTADGLEGVMAAFKSLPADERAGIVDPASDPRTPPARVRTTSGELAGVTTPPVVQPHDVVLADAAANSPLLQQVLALVAWVGPRRPATRRGVLRPAAAVEALVALGMRDAADSSRLSSARRHPELNPLWERAISAGMLEVRPTFVRAGLTRVPESDRELMDLWAVLFLESVDATTPLTDLLFEKTVATHTTLHALGAVADDGRLTALGAWGAGGWARSRGADVPVLRTMASASDWLAVLGPDLRPTVLDRWRVWAGAHRTDAASSELLDVVRVGTATDRVTAVVLGRTLIPGALADALVHAPQHPILDRYRDWLLHRLGRTDGPPATADDQRWVAVDQAACLLGAVLHVSRVPEAPPEVWTAAADLLDLGNEATVDHPDHLAVLQAISLGHPDERVRAQARRLVFAPPSRDAG